MSTTVYQVITDRILVLLEMGEIPWKKPWRGQQGAPRNLVSKREYQGINALVLNAMPHTLPFWLTFKQVASLGGRVRHKERACPVVFWKRFKIQGSEGDEKKEVPLLRYYSVFNVSQCDGIEKHLPPMPNSKLQGEPIRAAQQIIEDMPNRPQIKHGYPEAFYVPPEDYVGMPYEYQFNTWEGYYAVFFHELVHATGHAKRLDRPEVVKATRFGSDEYSREELVAEMGSAFLCAQAEFGNITIENSAAYIQNWLKVLKREPRMVVQAASLAQKAADYILGRNGAGVAAGSTEPANPPVPAQAEEAVASVESEACV